MSVCGSNCSCRWNGLKAWILIPACFIKIQHDIKYSVRLLIKSVEIGIGPSHYSIYHPGNAYPIIRPLLACTKAENYYKQIELKFVWFKKSNLDLNSFIKIFYSF